jgi:hypothetical protein
MWSIPHGRPLPIDDSGKSGRFTEYNMEIYIDKVSHIPFLLFGIFQLLTIHSVAGLNILSNLIDRAGSNTGLATATSHNRQEMMKNLESLLPHKEVMLKLIRSSLNDTDSNVTILATSTLKRMSWWP